MTAAADRHRRRTEYRAATARLHAADVAVHRAHAERRELRALVRRLGRSL